MTNELQKDGVVLQQRSKEDYHWHSHFSSGRDKAVSRARRQAPPQQISRKFIESELALGRF